MTDKDQGQPHKRIVSSSSLVSEKAVELSEVEDSHTVNYALKKLVKYGLVQSEKQGKEVFYDATQQRQA